MTEATPQPLSHTAPRSENSSGAIPIHAAISGPSATISKCVNQAGHEDELTNTMFWNRTGQSASDVSQFEERIVHRLRRRNMSDQEIETWMNTRLKALGQRSPHQFLQQTKQIDALLDFIGGVGFGEAA